jgi:integrase/recombinase XerD
MEKEQQAFRVVRARIPVNPGGEREFWLITKQGIPHYPINEWLDVKSIRKISTGKEYAHKLCVYLNYLHSKGKSFEDAVTDDVMAFFMQLINRSYEDNGTIRIRAPLSYSTLSKYITVITELYKWLEQVGDHRVLFQSTVKRTRSGSGVRFFTARLVHMSTNI